MSKTNMKDGILFNRDAKTGLVTLTEFVGREFVSYTLNAELSRGFDPARQSVATIWRACTLFPELTVQRTCAAI